MKYYEGWKVWLESETESYGIYDPENDKHHIIDNWGQVVYCEKFSAWNTFNPDYPRSDRTIRTDTKLVKLSKRDLDATNICKTCASRAQKGVCPNCRNVLTSKNGHCRSCGWQAKWGVTE